jgi:regulator of chromosome condensation
MSGSLDSSLNSSQFHLTTKTFLEPLNINTLRPHRKRPLAKDPDTMSLAKNKRSRYEKAQKDAPEDDTDETSDSRPTKVSKRGAANSTLNQAPSQRLDVYVFGSGESGELGLGHFKRNGKAPTNVKRPRLNDLLDAKAVGIVSLDVGGMRKYPLFYEVLFPIFCCLQRGFSLPFLDIR